jgi:hypothetical protein
MWRRGAHIIAHLLCPVQCIPDAGFPSIGIFLSINSEFCARTYK